MIGSGATVGRVSRRYFLRLAALTGAATVLGAAGGPAWAQLDGGRRKKRVIVVGAGLSGLVCTFELVRAGHDVVVLEARHRAGGRVRTDRSFADGMYGELGAARIPLDHELTLGYARDFSLVVAPFYPDEGAMVHFMRGRRVRLGPNGTADLSDYPIETTARERALGVPGIWGPAVGDLIPELGDPREPQWPLGPVRRYDGMTWARFLQERGVSDEVALVMGLGFSGSTRSAAWVLREVALAAQKTDLLRIVGGNDRLPLAFAGRLSEHIQYGTQVQRIEQTESGCTVFFDRAGRRESLHGERVVCTLPFPIVRGIEIAPEVSANKRRAIQEMSYGSLSRASIQVGRKYWQDEGFSGFARTDQVSELFHPTWDHAGSRGVIQLYMKPALSRRAGDLDADARIEFALDKIEEVFPGIRRHAEGGTCMCWDKDPHTQCTVAALAPGQLAGLLPHAGTPEGRIHFAGEHTSAWHAWMQGALASGTRAAREVHEA
ncbi:MAG: flavin monoamine oxidase family protein [Planctomycetota bacterium]|jgi:monoamine oxidase